MPIYKLDNDTYNIPDDVVEQFETDNPEAIIQYSADGDDYDIPVSEKAGFLSAFPNAKYRELETAKPAAVPQQQTQQQPTMQPAGQQAAGEQQYSEEVMRRYNSPDNKPGQFKDLAQIAAEVEREQSPQRMVTTGGAGYIPPIPDRPQNAIEEQQMMMQKMAELDRQNDWRNDMVETGMNADGTPLTSRKGELYDELYKTFGNAAMGAKPGDRSAYAQTRAKAEQMGIGDMATIQQLVGTVNREYAKEQAGKAVEAIMAKMPRTTQSLEDDLDAVYYDRDIQQQIYQAATSMGNDYDQYVELFVKPRLQQALKEKYGFDDNGVSGVRGLTSSWQNVQERQEKSDVGRMLGDYFAPTIEQAFKDADERANAVMQQHNESISPYADAGLDFGAIGATKKANEARDPKQILAELEKSLSQPVTEILQSEQMANEIFRRAEEKGISVTDYIDKYVAPQLTDSLRSQFEQTAIAREMPANDFEYIMRGLDNSIVGMIYNRLTRTESQQQYRNTADAAASEGRSIWAQGAQLATGMAADFWLWGGWGKIGSAATGKLLAERIAARAAADNITMTAAARLIEEEGKQYLGKGIVEGMMRHIPTSAITMGGAEATTEAVRGWRDREDLKEILGNTVGAAAGGAFTGTLFGVTGGTMGRLTSQLEGMKRLAGKLAGFGVEAGTMYTAEELQRMNQGEEAFANPFEGLFESAIKLGFIKASNLGFLHNFQDKDGNWKPMKQVMQDTMKADKPLLNADDVKAIEESASGKELMEALTAMKPARTQSGEKAEGYITPEQAERGAAAYRNFMTDPEQPFERKQKVAHLMDGVLPPAGQEVSFETVNTDDGTVIRTRDLDGQLIRELKYSTPEEADAATKKMLKDLDWNEDQALRTKIDMYESYQRLDTFLDDEYQQAAAKMQAGEELSDRERMAIYLRQHKDDLIDLFGRLNANGEISKEEEQLGNLYKQAFERSVRSGYASEEFTKEFEEANDLRSGDIARAMRGHSREEAERMEANALPQQTGQQAEPLVEVGDGVYRTADEQRLLDSYHQAMRDRIAEYEGREKQGEPFIDDNDALTGNGGQQPPTPPSGTAGEGAGTAGAGAAGGGAAGTGGAGAAGEGAAGGVTDAATAARRQAAYDRGTSVADDDSTLPTIGHDVRLAEARMMQQLPDSNPQLARLRTQIMDAIDGGDEREMDRVIAQAAPYLTPQQMAAVEAYRDMGETRLGVYDAITTQTEQFEQERRAELEAISDSDGDVTELLMNDGTTAYLKSGNLNNRYGGVIVTTNSGETRQVPVSNIKEVVGTRNMESVLEDDVNSFADQLQAQYEGFMDGSQLMTGQQVDMIISGEPITATVVGTDDYGNAIFQLADGSTMSTPQQDEYIQAANQVKIQQQLQAEAEAVQAQQRTQRFMKGIKGYQEGQPDLSAAETDTKVAADYIRQQIAERNGGDAAATEKERKQQLTDIQNTKEQLRQRTDEALQEQKRLQQWLDANEDIAEPEEVERVKTQLQQLDAGIRDLTKRQQQWGAIRRELMTKDELAQMEQERRRQVFKAQSGYQPQVEQPAVSYDEERIALEDGKQNFGLTSQANVNNYLLKHFEGSTEAEQFINEQRIALRNRQRDQIQPEINRRNDQLNAYAQGLLELTPDEVTQLVHEVADLQARQDMLSGQAVQLRKIAEGIADLYDRNGRTEAATPEAQRAGELAKAGSREDKLRIAQNVYKDYPEALDAINNQEPQTVEEYISQNLPFGKMNWEGWTDGAGRKHIGVRGALYGDKNVSRGIGKDSVTNPFNMYLAPTGEGMSFDDMVHYLYEAGPEVGDRKVYDDTEIRGALLDMLLGAKKPSDISHRVIDNRIAEAEDIVRQQEDYEREMEEMAKLEEMQQWAEAYHLTPEERETFEDFMKEPPTAIEQEIINQIIADNEEQNRGSQEMDSQHPGGAAGRDGQAGQVTVQGEGAEATAGGHPQQPRNEGAEAAAGVSAVPDTDVSGGAPAAGLEFTGTKPGVYRQESGSLPAVNSEARIALENERNELIKKRSALLLKGLRLGIFNKQPIIDEVNKIYERLNEIAKELGETPTVDKQGNPIDKDGNLIIEKIEKIDDISDTDFTEPSRTVELPQLPENVDAALGAEGKPVIIKKNIFEKNLRAHKDLTPDASRQILNNALYNTNLYGQTQPKSRPNYWVAIHTSDPNSVVVLEIAKNKDNVEIVGWRFAGERQLEELKKQAEREDGQLLILTSDKEAAAGLSTLPSSLSEGKDTNNSSNLQEKTGKSSIQGLDGYTEKDVTDLVEQHFNNLVSDDVEIVDIKVIGSRTTGTATPDSDLDVLVEYKGKAREDDLFNILNDEEDRLYIEDIPVDINPITAGKSGTIAEFLERNKTYDTLKDKRGMAFPARLAAAKAETDVNPTEAQKKAGNYKMGHVKFDDYSMSIENPKGSVRSGVDASGKPWSIKMQDTYGYIGRKYGADGDHLDFFINDDADLDTFNGRVYVVDQKSDDGQFDEHKVMYGYPTWSAARKAYERNYEPGWWDKHVMQMTGVRKVNFDKWLADSDHKTKPFADYFRTKILSDTVSDPTDQVMADIRDREQAAQIKPQYSDEELSQMDGERLTQLRKKAQQDLSISRVLLKTAGVGEGSEKEATLNKNIAQAEADLRVLDKEVQKRRDQVKRQQDEIEAGGAMVDHLKNMGIDLSTDISENRRVRRQAEKDNSQEGKLRNMTGKNGKVYGFTYRGKLYLDPRKLDFNLPLHEYGHLWCEAFRRLNPEGWKDVVSLMKKDADTWKFIKELNPNLDTDDDIAEEMITKGTGDRGEERIRQEYERMSEKDPSYKGKWNNIWKNISKAIQDFWKKVGDFLHIKYERPEQVYDQVLKDFANGVNPRKKVEQYLKERDDAYMQAVESGNEAKAKAIFDEALRENVGNGITPFIAAGGYRGLRTMAHGVKTRDPKMIAKVADKMAPMIPKDAVLVPAPSHEGSATDMLDLAQAISERTGAPVADVLKSTPRSSQYEAKLAGKALTVAELGITMQGKLPEGKLPVVIDNVVDSGSTAEACIQALGKGIVASLADSSERYGHVATLKSADPVVVDKNGNVVPLSKRFQLAGKYLEKAAKEQAETEVAEAQPQTEQPVDMAGEARVSQYRAGDIYNLVDANGKHYTLEVVGIDPVGELWVDIDGVGAMRVPADIVDHYIKQFQPKDETDKVMQEVEERKDKAEAAKTVDEYVKDHPQTITEKQARERATKAVLVSLDNAGVPYKVVSREEERQMMKLFSLMNQEAVKEYARKASTRARAPHGQGRYIVYNMENPFGVPMYAEKRSVAKWIKDGVQKYGGDWQILDIGYPDEAAEVPELLRKAAEMQAMTGWHGSGAKFDAFDHRYMGTGEGNQSYGWGTYITEVKGIGKMYADAMGGRHKPATYKNMSYSAIRHLSKDFYHTIGIENDRQRDILMGIVHSLNFGYGDPTIWIKVKGETLKELLERKQAVVDDAKERLKEEKDELDEKSVTRLQNRIKINEKIVKETQEDIDFINSLDPKEFEASDKPTSSFLYKVDIPDDTGENYFEWDGYLPEERVDEILTELRNQLLANDEYGWNTEAGRERLDKQLEAMKKMFGATFYGRMSVLLGNSVAGAQTKGKRLASELLSKFGYVGIKYPAEFRTGGREDNAKNYVIFNEDDAKITETIQFMIDDESDNGPIFYSNAMRAVEGIKQEKATPEQWLKMIEKGGGLKAGEDKWIGLSDWLKEQQANGKKSLTKQEIENFIRQNQIQVEEQHYAEGMPQHAQDKLDTFNQEFDELIWQGEDATGSIYTSDWVDWAYEQMVERYGDDFRSAFEIGEGHGTNSRLTPAMDYYDELSGAAKYYLGIDSGNEKPINNTRLDYTTDGLKNKKEIALTVPTIEPYNEDDDIHFGDAGNGRAVAWVRFGETTDADGKRVLVVDEIQSKRHQDAREKGYKPSKEEIRNQKRKISGIIDELNEKYPNLYAVGYETDGGRIRATVTDEEYNNLRDEIEVLQNMKKNNIPDAPFEKNWHELAMKRVLRYAAENGYDKIAWTTGAQQAERYNLSKAIKSVRNSSFVMGGDNWYTLVPQNAPQVRFHVGEDGKVDRVNSSGWGNILDHTLPELFGKDAAVKIEALKDGEAVDFENQQIGGEGMKGFYDQILPRFMDKYGKKWGVKTGEIELPELEPSAQKMWSVPVTPDMKESVMQGQPMFQKEGKHILGWSDGKQVYLTKAGLNPNTPLHEVTHLWDKWCQKEMPEMWSRLVSAMKKTKMWEEIRQNPNYRNIWNDENRMASEVHSRLTGAKGEEEFMNAAFKKSTPKKIIDEVKSVLRKFWESLLRLFGKQTRTIGDDFNSLEAIVRMPIRDLLNQDFEKVMKVAEEESAGQVEGHIELNVATARDKESRDYMRKVMADKGLTESESDEIMDIIDGVTDQVMKLSEKYPAFKKWQKTGIMDKTDPEEYDTMWRIMDSKVGWIPNRSAFKKNGEYPLNIDLGALCTKREAMDALMQIIVDQGGAQNLGPTQIEALKDLLKEEGFLTACDICFVETKRARAINDANRFAYEWQSVLEGLGITDDVEAGRREELTDKQITRLAEMTGKDYKKAFDKYIPKERRRTKHGITDLDTGITPDKMRMIARLMVQDASLAGRFNPEWLMTTRGTDWLFRTYAPHTDMGSVLAAMFGAATAKPLEGFNIYDPLSWKRDFDPKRYNEEGIYAIGGFRAQSFTDFNPILFLDYVQMFSDLAIRRLPMHVYTKVPSLIKLFGETGSMFNMSLVPAMVKGVDKAHAGLKPDGKGGWDYAWADESFPVDEAMQLRQRKEFGGRVGTIAVGVSDEHIRKMLDDENIDMIIPYHKSGMPKAVQVKTGLEDATDYTDVQNTQGAKGDHFNYNEQLQQIGDPRKTAQAYLDWCDQNGYTPKFPQFRDHENYYKLLEDFRGYDGDGKPVIQGPVRMKLTNDWKEQLDAALADRGDTDRRIGEMRQNKSLMEKAGKLLQYQRMDGEVRKMMMNRLGEVLGKGNVQSLRQEQFFDALEEAYAKSIGHAEAHAKVEVLRGTDGRVYGFSQDGKVVFNENLFNANTPAHEFTHVWVKVARKENPKKWDEGKQLLKQSQEWKDVMEDPLYKDIRDNEDAVASEALARIVGRLNEDFVRNLLDPSQKQMKDKKLYQKILDWLRDFFKGVRSIFSKSRKNLTFDEFIRMPMKDLWDETSTRKFREAVERLHEDNADSMVDTDVEMSVVTDKAEIERLEKGPKEIGYRNVVLNEDGTLGSPMANRLGKKGAGRKPTTQFEFGKWERSDENPDLADDNGKINLIKPNGKPVEGVDYNPYIHIRPNKVNKQFKEAWRRPELIYVETEYPKSELEGDYQAEKAAKPVGKHPWGGGELILSRWDKPLRMVPWEEVADDWVSEFQGRGIEFDIIPPKLLPILAERGVEILPPHKGTGKDCQEAYEKWKNDSAHKQKQLEIVTRENPMHDDIHTGIRTLKDIKTFDEAVKDEPVEGDYTPDYTKDMVEQAQKDGKITVYSSHPINSGTFVTPSKMEAQNYAGGGKVYSKEVPLQDVAWIDPLQGQYAKVGGSEEVNRGKAVNEHEDILFSKQHNHVSREQKQVEALNEQYNKDLKRYIERDLPSGFRFELGMPSVNLLSAGFPYLPISMRASLLARKAGDEKHPFEPSELHDLVKALQRPIAIFEYTKDNIRNLIVDVTHNDKHFLVGVTLNYKGDGIEINSVSGLFPKEDHEWIKWIADGKAVRIDQKDKVLDLISSLRTNPAESTRIGLNLNDVAKIVKDFQNPKVSEENLRKVYADFVVAAEETADMLGGVKVVFEPEASEKGTLGWYDPNDNSVHVVLPEQADVNEVRRTVYHEKLGHEGLVALLGSQAEVNKFGQFIFASAGKKLRQRIMEKADENDPAWKKGDRFSTAAQEVLADIAENGPRTQEEFSLWDKVKHYLIRLLNKLNWRVRGLLNDRDLAYYILKTGEALKRWKQMDESERQDISTQATEYDILRSRRGKPRKRNDESMAQYLQRLREWEKWKIAQEEAEANGDPMPSADTFTDKWQAKFDSDMAEWRRANNIHDNEQAPTEFPKRRNGESPQDFAVRVADYESQKDTWQGAPQLFDYLTKANDEYREAYRAWKERYDLAEAENVDMNMYEGAGGDGPQSERDMDVEARMERDLAEAVGVDLSSDGAKRQAKLAIIERRKNLESSNAEDAIWIHDFVKRTNELAKLQGVTGEQLREALPDIIEGTYFEEVLKDEEGNVIAVNDISDQLPIKKTPELEALLAHIKEWYDDFYFQIEDAGLRNDAGFIAEGYVNHIWDKEKSDPKAWEKYVENFQRTKSPNMRHREIDTYRDGRDVGLVPKFKDIADIMAYYSVSNNEAIANKKFLDDLSFIVVEQLNADGEVVSILPLLNSQQPSAFERDSYKLYYVPGVGDVWVLKDVQRQFANVFGTMRTQDIPDWLSKTGKVYDTVSSTAKKIELSFSAFHMGALTEVAMAQMRPDRAFRALAQYIIFDCAKAGTIPAYAHPEDFKLAASHLVQLGATQDYSASDVNNVTEKIREFVRQLADSEQVAKKGAGMMATPLAAALDYMNKSLDKVLWNYLHDGLKIACFKMFAEQVEKRVQKKGLSAEQREQLLDEAGQYVNDTFGGQYWELLNVSPALIKWLRRGFLSPDWLVSTQRHFLANFGFGSLYSESGFLNYLEYNRDNIKRAFGADIPRNENRRFRSKNAKQCYLLGVCGFFYIMMNALNALFRAQDVDKEKEKADEIRRDNPEYKSPYELAYPDGMKWYDYTMYGNTLGQQTHLFMGRYNDGAEWYARWGKQFREFPELFMGRHGVEFPTPLMERMSGKANPIGRYLLYDLPLTVGMYGYKQPRETQEIAEKYGNTIAVLAMTAKKFIPYSVPTQQDKEFKMFDLVMPSQKGFSRWKAVDFFKTYIQAGDMDGVMRTYNAAVMNGVDAEDCLKAAITTVKATQRKELADGITDLTTAFERYDATSDLKEKKVLRNKIIQYLAETQYKVFTQEDAREQVEAFLNGEQVAETEINKYIQLTEAADVRDDYRLSMIRKQAKKFTDEVKTAEGDRQRKLRDHYDAWFRIEKIIKDANRRMNKLKKQLGKEGQDDVATMKEIRTIRAEAQKQIDEVQAP